MANGIVLSILIPVIPSHQEMFDKLCAELNRQLQKEGIWNEIEILHELDDRVMSIGNKRQVLLNRSLGDFVVFIDADDWIAKDYCITLWSIIKQNPDIDCIGFLQECTFDGKDKKLSCISNEFSGWYSDTHGYGYVRTPFFPVPIRRDIAMQIGYKDMRYAEDKDFSDRLKQSGLIKNEFFTDKILYYYKYTYAPFEKKYGIKQPENDRTGRHKG